MSGLTFTSRGFPEQRLDLSPLIPSRLAGKSERQIASIVVSTTRHMVTVGDAFRISMGDRDQIVIRGGHRRLDRIGAGLDGGSITVSGDAGAYAGAHMSGGRLLVTGSVEPFAGAGMLNGLLEIRGDAGEGAGAALAGHMAGMRGGLIVVHGSAGTRAGDRMRRGLIAIGGDCGALAGSRMIAGTILVGGKLGDRPGMLMKRGTIMGASARNMLPTFNDCGRFELNFTSLYAMAFAAHGVKIPVAIARNVRRFAGDMASLGKGEILLVR